jgi:hypothetical protein
MGKQWSKREAQILAVLDSSLPHVFASFSTQTPIAEIRQPGRYARPVPWGSDTVGMLWLPSSAPFPGTCSGCLFRSRTGPSRTM